MNWNLTSEGKSVFERMVLEQFSFLRTDYGYSSGQIVRRDVIVFESFTIRLAIFLCRRSYWVGMDFVILSTSEKFSINEVVNAISPGNNFDVAGVAMSEQAARSCLLRLKHLCQMQLQMFLLGDETLLEAVRSITDRLRSNLALQLRYGPILRQGDKAWENKELKIALQYYLQAEPALSETQKRRLDYLVHLISRKDKKKGESGPAEP
jgi:hypothetical protein